MSPHDELADLYREIILEHGRRPRNLRAIEGADRSAEGYNPLCGDRVTVYLKLSDDGLLGDVSFTGSGCAICTASASLMTEHVKGREAREAREATARFLTMVRGENRSNHATEQEAEGEFDRLNAFAGVRRFPMRVKCATLPWHTLIAALEERPEPVSTE